MTDIPPERENPPAAHAAQTIYTPVATQITLAATAHGFLYSLRLRVVHHAPENISATMPSRHAELMLSIETEFASFMPPVISIKIACSAKKPRTRLLNNFMAAG